MNPTPETDNKAKRAWIDAATRIEQVDADFARKLEREREDALAKTVSIRAEQLEQIKRSDSVIKGLISERDEARHRNTLLLNQQSFDESVRADMKRTETVLTLECDKLRAELKEQILKKSELFVECGKRGEQLESLRAELADAKLAYQGIQELDKDLSEDVKELKAEIVKANAEIERLKIDVVHHESTSEIYKEQRDKARQDLAAFKAVAAQLASALNSAIERDWSRGDMPQQQRMQRDALEAYTVLLAGKGESK